MYQIRYPFLNIRTEAKTVNKTGNFLKILSFQLKKKTARKREKYKILLKCVFTYKLTYFVNVLFYDSNLVRPKDVKKTKRLNLTFPILRYLFQGSCRP